MSHRPKKILFVCSQKQRRSLTAEKIYEGFAQYQVQAAGTDHGAKVRVSAGHIGWADWIFVMEDSHLQFIQSKYGELLSDKNLVCLNLEDKYEFMNKDLVDLLKAELAAFIEVPE
jgi:predicted protein tyrosine phosphatase